MDTLCLNGAQMSAVGGVAASHAASLTGRHLDFLHTSPPPQHADDSEPDDTSTATVDTDAGTVDVAQCVSAVLSDASLADGVTVSQDGGLCWHGTQLATFCGRQRVFRCSLCPNTAFVARQLAQHWLSAHANFKSFQCPRCPYMSSWQRCVRMHLIRHHNDRASHVVEFDSNEALLLVQDKLAALKRLCERSGTRGADVTGSGNEVISVSAAAAAEDQESIATRMADEGSGKRHFCPYCPYSTHRRDLYNRHENIHKTDKPFHCYICKKMFNRADHVKKHFLRIHRDVAYDVKLIRRIPPKTLTAQVYYARAPAMSLPSHGTAADMKDGSLAASDETVHSPTSQTTETSLPASLSSVFESCCSSEPAMSPGERQTVSPRHSRPDLQDAFNTTNASLKIKHEPPSDHCLDTANDARFAAEGYNEVRIRQTATTLTGIKQEAAAAADTDSDEFAAEGPTASVDSPSASEELTIDGRAEWRQQQDRRTDERHKRRQECFACPQCPWRGFDSWCLKRHVNTHTKPYTCSLCSYKAARSERLSFHVARVHNKRVCVKCFIIFERQDALNEHMLDKHGTGHARHQFTCLTCACSFGSHDQLQTHMVVTHRRRILHCRLCAFSTTDPLVLDDHARYSHSPECAVSGDLTDSAAVPPPPVILNVPSVSPPPLPPPTAVVSPQHPCEQCRTAATPLLCVHDGRPLSCCAADCRHQEATAAGLQRHVAARHDDGAPRCPHCALLLRSPLELSVHWPTHHSTLCWACVLLVQRHCTFVAASEPTSNGIDGGWIDGDDEAEDSGGAGGCCREAGGGEKEDEMEFRQSKAPLDYSAFLTLELAQEEDAVADVDHLQSDADCLMRRARKQSRPKRLLADGPVAGSARRLCTRVEK